MRLTLLQSTRSKFLVLNFALLFIFNASAATPRTTAVDLCEAYLSKTVLTKKADNHVPVSTAASVSAPVAITGEATYSTPLVLGNLGLRSILSREQQSTFTVKTEFKAVSTPSDALARKHLNLSSQALKGKKVLSLGEGYSGFTPFLRNQGIEAYGLDLWYAADTSQIKDAIGGEFMHAYREAHGDYLIAGDATNLRSVRGKGITSIEDNTFDMVTSHMMIGYLTEAAQFQMIQEAIRVVKPGGEVRIAFFEGDFSLERFNEVKGQLEKNGFKFDGMLFNGSTKATLKSSGHPDFQDRPIADSFPVEQFQQILDDGVRAPPVKNDLSTPIDLMIFVKTQ